MMFRAQPHVTPLIYCFKGYFPKYSDVNNVSWWGHHSAHNYPFPGSGYSEQCREDRQGDGFDTFNFIF